MWLDRISPQPNTLWRGSWPGHFVEPARYLYDHELVLFSKGKATLEVEDRHWEMTPGSFAIIPPDTKHVTLAREGSVFRSCIHFDWISSGHAARRPLCSYYPKRPARRWLVPKPAFVPFRFLTGSYALDGAVPALVETIFLRWQTQEVFHRALCRSALLELLIQLLYPSSRRAARPDRVTQLAYAAKEKLDQEGRRSDISIVALLESLGYSYPHVCRLFRKTFGLSPVAYLNAQRLERAKSLLRQPRITIAEVAYQSGFRDPGYFTRLFHKQTGQTPGRFRGELR